MASDLTLDGVGHRYPRADRDALHGITTTFRAGAHTAVMGATGAGKSTLLQTLCGLVPALSGGSLRGSVRYGRANLADHAVATISQYIGLVLQDPASQLIGRTVAEDVGFGPRNHLVPAAEIGGLVAGALARVGLAGFEARSTAELSGGELQRLAIAGVLAMRPEMLCLDEATSELDPDGAADVRRVLAGLQSGGMGLIAAEHDPAAVLDADALVVLDQGALAWQGRPVDFFADPARAASLGIKPAPVAVAAREFVAARGEVAAGPLPVRLDEAEEWFRQRLGPLGAAPAVPRETETSGPPAIEITGLEFAYPGQPPALCGIDLRIVEGEFVALVGANGAGKTTLIKQLNGLLRPTAGRVALFGRGVGDRPVWELAREIGFVFQNPDHQLFCRSVSAEVGYGLKLAGLSEAGVRRRVAEVLELTGLSDVAEQNPLTLGRGERQLVAVATALASHPRLLVIDEPTTGQDRRGVQAVMALIGQLHAQGTTVLMISHDLDLVAAHAKRVIRLDGGRVVADGPADALVQTDLTRLWARLFGPQATPPMDARLAGRLLAGQPGGAR